MHRHAVMQELGEQPHPVLAGMQPADNQCPCERNPGGLPPSTLPELPDSRRANDRGSHKNLGDFLHPLEASGAREGERSIPPRPGHERPSNIVPAVAQHFQAAEERFAVHEQVGDEHDQAAPWRIFSYALMMRSMFGLVGAAG